MSSSLTRAVVKTLCYSHVFNFPLTIGELHEFLIGYKLDAGNNQELITKAVNKIPYISALNGYYYLSGRKNIVAKRLKKSAISREKLKLAGKYVRLLKFNPFVLMVAVSGNLSIGNSAKEDDIDIFLITRKNRLWLTRLITVICFKLTGRYRHPHEEKAPDKICLNMLLDEDHLCVLKQERDLFSAHEIAQLKPLIAKNNIYGRFIRSNLWAKRFLPNFKPQKPQINLSAGKFRLLFLSKLTDKLELLAYKLQLLYMKDRITNEKITGGYVRFHPRDVRHYILKKYNQNMLLYQKDPP